MSGPTKAGEPSMEEILASIRKIIADDPTKAATDETSAPGATLGRPMLGPASPSGAFGDARAPAGQSPAASSFGAAAAPTSLQPLSSSSPGLSQASDAGNRSNPSFGRLSEALRTTFANNPPTQPSSGSFATTRFGQSAPSSPLSVSDRDAAFDPPGPAFGEPAERSRTIDNELDDLLDEPLAQEPAPAAGAKPSESSDNTGSGQWAVWRSPSGKPADGDASGPASAAPGPSGSQAPSMPSLGRPTGGFYPGPGGYAQTSLPPSTPSTFGSTGRFEPTLPEAVAETINGLGALVPQRDDAKAASPAMSRSPRFEHNLSPGPSRPLPSESNAPPPMAPKPAAVVIAAMPSSAAAAQPPSFQPQPSPPPTAPYGSSAAAGSAALQPASSMTPSGLNVPLPPRTTLFSRPIASPKAEPVAQPVQISAPLAIPPPDRSRSAFGSTPPPVKAPEPSSRAPALPLAAAQAAASTSALDALAAGFAASNVQVPPAAAQPVSASAPPVQTAPPAPDATMAGLQAVAGMGAGPARSLEDMITDMVKPMLQKWLTDNMPRIIEKALRSEASQPGGGGSKPPGT